MPILCSLQEQTLLQAWTSTTICLIHSPSCLGIKQSCQQCSEPTCNCPHCLWSFHLDGWWCVQELVHWFPRGFLHSQPWHPCCCYLVCTAGWRKPGCCYIHVNRCSICNLHCNCYLNSGELFATERMTNSMTMSGMEYRLLQLQCVCLWKGVYSFVNFIRCTMEIEK